MLEVILIMEKQSLIKGTIVLGIAGIATRFLGLFFRWPLIMLIGDEGVGYYQMAYPLYMFFIAMASGVPVAMSKLIAEKNAINDKNGIHDIIRKSLLLMIVLGGGFSAFLFFNSNLLINIFQWDKKSLLSLKAMAVAPIFIALLSVFRGTFQGMQNMTPTAVSEIIEQIGRVLIGVGLAILLLPKGIEFSAAGATLGAAAGGLAGAIYLLYQFFKTIGLQRSRTPINSEVLNRILYTAIPISLGATVGTIMSLIDSIIVPRKLLLAGFTAKQATILYGQLTGKAYVLINVPLTLSIALSATLVPVIAEQYFLKNMKVVKRKVDTAMTLSSVIALPSLCGLYFMSEPIFTLIFPGRSQGDLLLKYLALSIPFIIMAQITTAILQSTGKYIAPVVNLSIGCLIKIIVSTLLIPIKSINIFGAIIGTIMGYVVACTLNLLILNRELKVKIDLFKLNLRPVVASLIMTLGVVIINYYVYNITKSLGISCIISIFLGAIIYIALIFRLGILKEKDFVKRERAK